MADGTGRHQQIQEGARNGNGGEHTDDHAQEKRSSESNNDARAEIATEVVQYSAGDQRRNVRIADGRPRFPQETNRAELYCTELAAPVRVPGSTACRTVQAATPACPEPR